VAVSVTVDGGGVRQVSSTTGSANPWSVPIAVAQIPDTGMHREFKANADQCLALADLGGLREVKSANASLDIALMREGRVHVVGRVRARIGQTCVVTLDPIENDIDEAIDLIFAPPEQIQALADLVDDAAEGEAEIPDPPEPIVDGTIDLGRLATDALFLGVDPYPRKSDAVFEPPLIPDDPEDHPFAALKALKSDPDSPDSDKPKGR
jgi:Large ribosomal RNA subunit accumulation protein YceD